MRRQWLFLALWSAEIINEATRNQEKDRHVAAVAVKANAEVIVTSNLKDFRKLPPGIEAQSPDEFLVCEEYSRRFAPAQARKR